jgi:folate-binding protein YgfZ
VVSVSGADARTFLQGLISNDVDRLSDSRALYAALLTPQGRYLHDFFLLLHGSDEILLDCVGGQRSELQRRLQMYRLRSKVCLADRSPDFAAFVVTGDGAAARFGVAAEAGAAAPLSGGGIVFVDPRLATLGLRVLLPSAAGDAPLTERGCVAASLEDYDLRRLVSGVPDGAQDLVADKSLLLECSFDELNGIDWQKGCYIGQEVTARTRYRGLLKRRLVPVAVTCNGPLPPPGTLVLAGASEAGELRSGQGDIALALLRLDDLKAACAGLVTLTAGDCVLEPRLPPWLSLGSGGS